MDPVNPKALKGKFKDREDKDIDNDGEVDSSDEYLHKRRQAVSKAIGKIKEEVELDEAKTDVYHKHMLKALGKTRLPKDHSYTSAMANNGDFVVHDGGGRVVGRIPKGEHSLNEVSTEKLRDYASAALQDKNKAKADKRWKYASKALNTVADREVKAAHARKYNKMEEVELDEKTGLWDNIHAKRKRIEAGSGEKMRKPGSKGAPTNADFKSASESVEHITESENRDYIKSVLSRHLNHNKVTHKVSSAVGYDKFDVGNNTHISHDGVGLSVKHKGKEVAYYSKPRLEYKDAAKTALKHSMNEEVEQIDEIQINWNHKTQKHHTIKHPDGSHWGVFDHSTYGTKGHEIRKIRDSEGNALKAKDSRKGSGSGYKAGMGSPSDAAKEWAKKHGGTVTNHKLKESMGHIGAIQKMIQKERDAKKAKEVDKSSAEEKPMRMKMAQFRKQELS